MSVRVAIPMLYTSLRLHLEKGRQWNVVEHILLHRVSLQPSSATLLAEQSNLPWRLVVEVMIRLMRVGWVELQTHGDETRFQITVSGRIVVGQENLPKATRPISRRVSFAIDQVKGTVYRAREFPTLYTPQRLATLQESTKVLVLPPSKNLPMMQPAKVLETLLEEDEECKDLDPTGARAVTRYALVTVVGATIDGLPNREASRLRSEILAAAGSASTESESIAPSPTETDDESRTPTIPIKFSYDDFIIGGAEHSVAFDRILKQAKERIVIHSTFIDHHRFRDHFPLIEKAARRGVRIDILWGKSDDTEGKNTTADAVAACRAMLISDVVRERVRLHGISTDSHAKLIVADNGHGGLLAVIGSCNWLSSGFQSFEVSAYIRAPKMVAEVADKLATMAMGASGSWTPLTRMLASLSTRSATATPPRTGITVNASLVLGACHNDYMLMARDNAKSTITVASHRLSPSAETLVFMPTRAAVAANDVAVKIYYGKVTGADGGTTAVNITGTAQKEGMRVAQIHDPRLHAKFLAWDNDCVLITSQNWLSADPADDLPLSEIGIFISGPGMAREFVGRVKAALELNV